MRRIEGMGFTNELGASFWFVLVVTGCQQTKSAALHDNGV